jgi:hypothetical protein
MSVQITFTDLDVEAAQRLLRMTQGFEAAEQVPVAAELEEEELEEEEEEAFEEEDEELESEKIGRAHV